MIRHNDRQKFNLRWKVENKGNWNKDNNNTPLYTKPLAYISFINRNNDKDEQIFIFSHDNILELITAYYMADIKSIKMINDNQSGDIKNFEKPFLNKVDDHIKFLKEITLLK